MKERFKLRPVDATLENGFGNYDVMKYIFFEDAPEMITGFSSGVSDQVQDTKYRLRLELVG